MRNAVRVAKLLNSRRELAEHATVSVAGRITAHRDMGKSMFIDVRDQSGRIQCYAQKNVLGDEQFHIFTHLDLGDFVGVTGTLFRTKTGEPSIKLEAFTILAKALRPPPAKWHGLEDTEIRYRQRYLDLIANPDVKDVMLKRSAIVREIRNFFHERGYVEVETPVMQAIPGGAAAQPFKTFHNALGCEFYLRIALELYHKRLLVGGIDKLFEIGKNFRNEGAQVTAVLNVCPILTERILDLRGLKTFSFSNEQAYSQMSQPTHFSLSQSTCWLTMFRA